VNESPAPAWSQQFRKMGVEVAGSRRVLLVDDERENLEVLGALLEDDFEIHLALGGAEALSLFSRVGDFAAVISDQRMPGMTGVELLTELGRRAPATVRMVVTAYTDLPPIVAAVNEGSVYRLFLKPWNPHEMRAAVEDAVWMYEAEGALKRLVTLLALRKRDLAVTLENLQRSQLELLASERMSTLGRFSAGITHNIRNSLTVMMHLLDVVQQDPTEKELVRSAQHAFQTLDSLLHLANDVNALARGRLDAINASPVSVAPFLGRITAEFAEEPLGRTHPTAVTIAPSATVLSFDPARLSKAVLALVRNTARTSAVGTTVEIVVHPLPAPPQSQQACLEIRASEAGRPGIGALPPGSPESAELALGLEVARVVAEAHGGRLSVRPRAGTSDAIELWLGNTPKEIKPLLVP
jgi:CheY-like chemotaxis protein